MANVKYPNMKTRRVPQVSDSVSRKMAKSAQDICMALSIAILADVFGFGDKRIHQFQAAYLQLAESLGVGTDTIDQIQNNIYDRFGIRM